MQSWSPPEVKTKKPDHFWPGSGYDGVLDTPLPGIPSSTIREVGVPRDDYSVVLAIPPVFTFRPSYPLS